MSSEFWINENSKLLKFLTKLSGLSSLGGNKSQLLSLFDTLLADLTDLFSADSSYIHFQVPAKTFKNNKFERSHGVPIEYGYNLHQITSKIQTNLLDTDYQYLYNLESMEDERFYEGIKMLGIKSIISIPILGTDEELAAFNLHYDSLKSTTPKLISSIHTLADLLATSYISTNSQISVLEEILERNEYFFNSFDYLFALDSHYYLTDVNKRANDFLGKKSLKTEINFTTLISNQTDIDTFYSIVKTLKVGQFSEETIFTIKSPIANHEEKIMTFGLSKFRSSEKIYLLVSGREINQDIISVDSGVSMNNENNIIPQVSEFNKLFSINQELAIDNYIDQFFPASFVFSANEITGPIVVSSSPKIDPLKLLQEVAKLMSALNMNELISKTFITGSTPWSTPSGDLHWIAFSINNPMARGGIEIHIIGVVIKNNLITVKPKLHQSLNGSLMGGMNDFISIIVDDEADFITKAYNRDRNFSTVSLIGESLAYLRHISIELLGTLSIGQTEF